MSDERKKNKAGKKNKAAKKAKATKKNKAVKKSLLSRLFGDRKNAKKGQAAKVPKAKAKPLTPLQRSIAEIRQMKKIGDRDPERLAQLLVAMLGKERAKEEEAKRRLDKQVWDIIHRSEQKEGEPPPEEGDGSGRTSAPT